MLLFNAKEMGWTLPEHNPNGVSLGRQDDFIFKRAREVNCHWFRNIIVNDIIRPMIYFSVPPYQSIRCDLYLVSDLK